MGNISIVVAVSDDRPHGKILGRGTQANFIHLKAFHRLCTKYAVQPTYLLSYTALRSNKLDWLVDSVIRREADAGTLLQSWTTPPFAATENRLAATKTSALSHETVVRKLESLREAFSVKFQYAPTTNMTEAWDYSSNLVRALEACGFTLDCSYAPAVSESVRYGHSSVLRCPFFPSPQNPFHRGNSQLLECPVLTTNKTVSKLTTSLSFGRAFSLLAENEIRGEKIILDPLRTGVRDSRAAIEHALRCGYLNLVIPFQSYDLGVGTSTLASSNSELSDLLQTLDHFFLEVFDNLRLSSSSLAQTAAQFTSPRSILPAPHSDGGSP